MAEASVSPNLLCNGLPSGARWTTTPSNPTIYHRPLGILELKFDQAAQQEGQGDSFLRLLLRIEPQEGDETFWKRLLVAWCATRCLHPALEAVVETSLAGEVGEEEKAEVRATLGLNRVFKYVHVEDEEETMRNARESILVVDCVEGDVGRQSADLLEKHILNGERKLLDQAKCLARLILVRDTSSRPSTGSTERIHHLYLVISHVISDGVSLLQILKDFFEFLTSASFPTPEFAPDYIAMKTFLAQLPSPPLSHPLYSTTLLPWPLTSTKQQLVEKLPLSSEEKYPPLPLSHSPIQPSLARKRWFWAISSTLIRNQHSRYPRSLLFPRIPTEGPPKQAHTAWPTLRFDQEITSLLFKLCLRYKLSPSMLLYSILSIAVANRFAILHSEVTTYHPIIFGFPISLRPFLVSANAPVDAAIRITFGCINLPNFPQVLSQDYLLKVRGAAIRGARLAKKQFTERLSPEIDKRNALLASSYMMVLDRLQTSLGINTSPFLNEPRGAINASMIGDLDRILPRNYVLPCSSNSSLILSDMALGTRLHRGEGTLLEAYTFDKMLTVALGFDDLCVESQEVQAILDEVRAVGELLAHGEKDLEYI